MKIWLKAAVVAACFLMSFGGTVAAQSDSPWAVRQSVSVAPDRLIGCHGSFQSMVVEGVGRVEGCYVAGVLRTLKYETQSGVRLAVSKSPVGPLFPLKGACEHYRGCDYLAATDRLVDLTYIQRFAEMQVYDDFSEKITLKDDSFDGIRRYVVNNVSSTVIKGTDGLSVIINAFASSRNGQWVAAELPNKGTARIDLTTKTIRRVIAPGYEYDRGMDPAEQLAISDDGRTVVVTGMNAGFTIAHVDEACGDKPFRLMEVNIALFVQRCPVSDGGIGTIEGGFRTGFAPELQGNDRLSVLVQRRVGEFQQLTIRPASAPEQERLEYLAMGDSFSSGEGETDDLFYLPNTNTSSEKCHTSRRSYPYLVAAAQGMGTVQNVACSGARIGDVVSQSRYFGQQQRLLGKHGQASLVQAAVDTFIPGRIPQADFVDRYTPKHLTIGIGGNDAGMMDKLQACAMPTECRWVSEEGKQQTLDEINRLGPQLVGMYELLRRRSPDTIITAVGYPKILNHYGACDALTRLLFTRSEREYMTESVIHLNKVIAAAAQIAGLAYVDVEDIFMGAALCDEGESRAMNGFRFGQEAGLFASMPALHFIGSETFHPTPYGHELVALKVAEYLGNPSCGLCGQASGPTETSGYWTLVSGPVPVPTLLKQEMVAETQGARREVSLPMFSFAPSSKVRMELHSEKTVVGEPLTTEQGSLSFEFDIPSHVGEGFHTLYAYGETDSGESVGYYQTIRYQKAVPEENEPEMQVGRDDEPSINQGIQAAQARASVLEPAVLSQNVAASSQAPPLPKPIIDAIKTSTWYWLLPVFILLGIMAVWLVFARRSKN